MDPNQPQQPQQPQPTVQPQPQQMPQQPMQQSQPAMPPMNQVPKRSKAKIVLIVLGVIIVLFGILAAVGVLLINNSFEGAEEKRTSILETIQSGDDAAVQSLIFDEVFADSGIDANTTNPTDLELLAQAGVVLGFVQGAFTDGTVEQVGEQLKASGPSNELIAIYTDRLTLGEETFHFTTALLEEPDGDWIFYRYKLWAEEPSEAQKLRLVQFDFGADVVLSALGGQEQTEALLEPFEELGL